MSLATICDYCRKIKPPEQAPVTWGRWESGAGRFDFCSDRCLVAWVGTVHSLGLPEALRQPQRVRAFVRLYEYCSNIAVDVEMEDFCTDRDGV